VWFIYALIILRFPLFSMFEFIKTRGLFQILCGSNAYQMLDKNTLELIVKESYG
jgi:hypothetical protein